MHFFPVVFRSGALLEQMRWCAMTESWFYRIVHGENVPHLGYSICTNPPRSSMDFDSECLDSYPEGRIVASQIVWDLEHPATFNN